MAGKHTRVNDKKKKWPWVLAVCTLILLITIIILLLSRCSSPNINEPTLIIETPQKLSLSETDEFTLEVTVSDLGESKYPAMSMSISFDSSRLELLGIEEGNVFIEDDKNSSGQKLPDWSYNINKSNEKGVINIMYLDVTGGKYAFSKDLLSENDNVMLRLKFRLRGSARAGDVYDLIFEDAVFAASDENFSLAMLRDTLKVRNGKIIIGE